MRNIVMVTYDSLRADHCGYMGYERDTTPNLDAMAEEGVAFTNAIAPASRTNPSMAGVMTGEPMVFRDRVANPENSRYHLSRHGTIAEELSAKGYSTGAFNPNAYASRYYGFDRGFEHFEDFLFSSDRYQDLFEKHLSDSAVYGYLRNLRNFVRREEAFRTWDTYIDDVQDWIRKADEPFFLWIFAMDTHFPHLTPSGHRHWGSLFDQYYYNWRCNQLIDQFDIDLSEKERQKIIDIYDDSIRFGDVLLAELQEHLDAFDPVYVIHGDHGEAFGERGIYGHFHPSLYEENIHVPLVVSEEIDGSVEPHQPHCLTDIGGFIRPFAGSLFKNVPSDWVIASDYDGRNDRNLIAIRTKFAKQIATWKNGELNSEEAYWLDDNSIENTQLSKNQLSCNSLKSLMERRYLHEEEISTIQTVDLRGGRYRK